jgi:chemotaxis protein CheX
MKSANELITPNGVPEGWAALLELSVREVFEIMLGSKLVIPENAEPVTSDFTAMVGLAGQLCGVLTVRCSSQSAAQMASIMLGIDPKQAGDQVFDAIGEVCNMIAGNFKNKLTGIADHCMLSVPTVITGADFSFHSLADSGPLEFPFLFEGQPVLVALEIHS